MYYGSGGVWDAWGYGPRPDLASACSSVVDRTFADGFGWAWGRVQGISLNSLVWAWGKLPCLGEVEDVNGWKGRDFQL